MTLSDLDIYRSAALVIKQYEEDPQAYAIAKSETLMEQGDQEGSQTWVRILMAITELINVEPPEKPN